MADRTDSRSKVARALSGVLVLAVLAGTAACGKSGDDEAGTTPAAATQSASPLDVKPEVKPGTGTVDKIVITEIVPGTGAVVQKGQTITVNYTVISYKTGELIDSSWKESGPEPFSAQIGVGQLIPGWDQAVPGQKVGSRLQLDVPADLAYGPSKGDLRFVLDILDAK